MMWTSWLWGQEREGVSKGNSGCDNLESRVVCCATIFRAYLEVGQKS